MTITKSICHLRWGYPNISLARQEVRTCCKTPFQRVSTVDIIDKNINLFLNSDYQIKRRYEMLKGIRHNDCNSCWQVEDKGATSLRGNGYENFKSFMYKRDLHKEFGSDNINYIAENVTLDSDILKSNSPFMLEVSLGNTCDMKCMYCNHVYSSQWATESLKNKTISIEEYKKVSEKPNENFTNLFWEWFNKDVKNSVERIGLIGGEPLITNEFYNFLENLMASYQGNKKSNTVVWVVTNLNTEEKYFNKFIEFIPKLTDFFELEIHISMESLYNQAEYIRNGLSWERFENNVNKLYSLVSPLDKVTLAFLPSITALSIPKFGDFIRYVFDLSIRYKKPTMLKQNIVTWPNPHSPFILPSRYSKYLDGAIGFINSVSNNMPNFKDEYGRWNNYNLFLINLKNSIANNKELNRESCRQFYIWFSDFDRLRNLDFKSTFPELADFYEQCRSLI